MTFEEMLKALDYVLSNLNGARDIELYQELKAFYERKEGVIIRQKYGKHYIL